MREILLEVKPAFLLHGRIVDAYNRSVEGMLGLEVQAIGNQTRIGGKLIALQDGQFEVKLPMLRLDARLAVPGFAPNYVWALQPTGPRVNLGAIRLSGGSSVSGRLVGGDASASINDARVTLSPAGQDASRQDTERSASLAVSVKGNANGFFQFLAVAPGRYHLEALRRDGTEMVTELVTVGPDSETYLGDIVIRPTVNVTFRLSPPRDPSGEHWRIRLRPMAALKRGAKPIEELCDTEGLARFIRIAGQDYIVEVRDARASRYEVRQESIGADREISINVPLVSVQGRVRLGDVGVKSTVSVEVGESDRAQFVTDAGGRFEGLIRRPTKSFLIVGVVSQEPYVDRTFVVNDFDPSIEPIELDLALPNGQVGGFVLSGQNPARNGWVTVKQSARNNSTAQIGKGGRFDFSGLAFGEHEVWASREDGISSEPVKVHLSSDRPATEVQLQLPEDRSLAGRLVSGHGGGVPGAEIVIQPLGAGQPLRSVVTSVDGRFSSRVPASARRAQVQVSAPSELLWSGCVEIPERDVPFELTLPPLPASEIRLRVTRPRKADALPNYFSRPVLFTRRGGVVELDQALRWESRGGRGVRTTETKDEAGTSFTEYRISALAPDDYAVSWSATPWHALASNTCLVGPPQGLEWSFAAPGGIVVLALPEPPPAPRVGAGR